VHYSENYTVKLRFTSTEYSEFLDNFLQNSVAQCTIFSAAERSHSL